MTLATDQTRTDDPSAGGPLSTRRFRHRLAIIKADDLGREETLDWWWRALDLVDARGIPMSVGVVTNGLARHAPGALNRLALQLQQGGHEVWNHSHSHPVFSTLSYEQQAAELSRSQQILLDTFGSRPTLFGAPFNAMNRDTVKAAEDSGDFTGIYFSQYPTRLDTIPYENLCPPEFVSGHYRQPDFVEFGPRLERRRDARPIVLQIHPPAWSQVGLNEFARIVDFLIEDGWQFLTFDEFVEYRRWSEGEGPPPASVRPRLAATDEVMSDVLDRSEPTSQDFSWYAHRYDAGTAYLRNILERCGFNAADQRDQVGLDAGCGSGNWTAAYAALSKRHRAVGVDQNDAMISILQAASGNPAFEGRVSFKAGSLQALPFEARSFDHVVCNNAINYAPVGKAAREIQRVLKGAGAAYLGVHNRGFWLNGFLTGLLEGSGSGALRRIDQLGHMAAIAAGRPQGVRGNYARIFATEGLALILRITGLTVKQIDPPNTHERMPMFEGHSTFTVLLALNAQPMPASELISDAPVARVDRALIDSLLVAGLEEEVLGYVERLMSKCGALTFDNAIERAVVSAACSVSERGGTIPAACRRIAERHAPFRAAAEACLAKDYVAEADLLAVAARAYPQDRAAIIALVMSLYSATRFDEALSVASNGLGTDEDRTEAEWMVYLTAVCAAEGVESAASAMKRYLARRLMRVAAAGNILHDLGHARPTSAPPKELVRAAFLRNAIESLGG